MKERGDEGPLATERPTSSRKVSASDLEGIADRAVTVSSCLRKS